PVPPTVLQPPAPDLAPPPPVSPLASPSTVPRVRVLDSNGQTIQTLKVTNDGLTIGREQDNDVVLPVEAVSHHHLQVMWDGSQVTVKDLGSSNGSWLADNRLLPQTSQVWTERQVVRLGPYLLQLEMPRAESPTATFG